MWRPSKKKSRRPPQECPLYIVLLYSTYCKLYQLTNLYIAGADPGGWKGWLATLPFVSKYICTEHCENILATLQFANKEYLYFKCLMMMSLIYPSQMSVAALPIPPVVDMTSGVKVACSTLCILCSYCLLFSCSCRLYTEVRGLLRFHWVHGLITLTSTNALSKRPPQKPYMATSRRASSSVIAELYDIDSPESG